MKFKVGDKVVLRDIEGNIGTRDCYSHLLQEQTIKEIFVDSDIDDDQLISFVGQKASQKFFMWRFELSQKPYTENDIVPQVIKL